MPFRHAPWALLLPFPVTLAAMLALSGCSIAGDCENKMIEEKADLEGGLAAWKFVRDCGATTGYSTNIAVGDHANGLEAARIVFTVDSDHGAAELDGKAVWSQMVWTGPHRLSVAYAERARVFRSEAQAAGATITYRATSRAAAPPPPPPSPPGHHYIRD